MFIDAIGRTKQKAPAIGQRIMIVEKAFNTIQRGFSCEDDMHPRSLSMSRLYRDGTKASGWTSQSGTKCLTNSMSHTDGQTRLASKPEMA
jgi:hypothetical protein